MSLRNQGTLPKQKRTGASPGRNAGTRKTAPSSSAQRADQILAWIVYPALLLAVIFFMTVRPISEADFWFHATLGKYFSTMHALPFQDVFSYTASGRTFVSTGWLSAWLLYLLYTHVVLLPWQGAGPILLVFTVTTAGYLGTYFYSLRRYRSGGVVILALLAGLLTACLRLTPRPDLFSQLFIALTLLLLLRPESAPAQAEVPANSSKHLWLLPPLFLLWANMHPGFIAGLIALGFFALYHLVGWMKTRHASHLHTILPCALCMVVWLANPYFYRVLTIAATIGSIPQLQERIKEYIPIYALGTPLPAAVYAAFLILLGLYGIALRSSTRRVPWWQPAFALAIFGLALTQRRQLGLAGIVFPVLMLPHLDGLKQWFSRWRLALPLAVLLSTSAVIFAQHEAIRPKSWPQMGVDLANQPYGATEFLKKDPPPGKLFNAYRFGGYLMYQLWPQTKVFIDGRVDVYSHEVWLDYLNAVEGKFPLEALARKYQIRTFLLDISAGWKAQSNLANQLTRSPAWKLVYFDDLTAIFADASESYAQENELGPVTPFDPQRVASAIASGPAGRDNVFKNLKRALDLSSGSANALALTAIAHFAAGNTPNAQEFLSAAQQRDPACPLLEAATKP